MSLNPTSFLPSFFLLTVFRIHFSRHPIQSAPYSVKWSTPSLHPHPHPIPNSDVPHPQCLPSAEHIRTGKDTGLELTPLPLRRTLLLKNVDQICRVAPVQLALLFNLITTVNVCTLSRWLITLYSIWIRLDETVLQLRHRMACHLCNSYEFQFQRICSEQGSKNQFLVSGQIISLQKMSLTWNFISFSCRIVALIQCLYCVERKREFPLQESIKSKIKKALSALCYVQIVKC